MVELYVMRKKEEKKNEASLWLAQGVCDFYFVDVMTAFCLCPGEWFADLSLASRFDFGFVYISVCNFLPPVQD